MNRKYCCISLAFVLSLCMTQTVCAQNPYKKSARIKEIKANMKAMAYGKVLDNVKSAFKDYPEDAAIDPEYYYYSVQANYNLALEDEKKMYLKQRADTTKYFDYILSIICQSHSRKSDDKNCYPYKLYTVFFQNIFYKDR